jgi:hypothetical protein
MAEALAVKVAPVARSADAVRKLVDAATDELLADPQVVRLGAEPAPADGPGATPARHGTAR